MRLQSGRTCFRNNGPIKQIDGVTFCVIAYKNPVRYFFETKLDSNTSLLKAKFSA